MVGEGDALIGRLIAQKIELLRRLGSGGMGYVYLGYHRGLDKEVAVKVLSHKSDPTNTARFQREARAASRLDHPNAVRVLDFGEDGPDHLQYIVMERLEGSDLQAIIKQKRRVPPEEVIRLMIPVASVLASAHAQGFVHRDIKPSNIMLHAASEPDGTISTVVKVLDFGLAKAGFMNQDSAGSESVINTGLTAASKPRIGAIRPKELSDSYYVAVESNLAFGFMPDNVLPMPTGWSSDALVADPRTGHFAPIAAGLLQSLVLAQGSEAAIYGWSSEDLTQPAELGLREVVRFDGPLLDTPIFLDMNTDGRNDLVATVSSPGRGPVLEVALTSTGVQPAQKERACVVDLRLSTGEPFSAPLAAARLDLDAAPDFILPIGLAISFWQEPRCGDQPTYVLSVRPLDEFIRAVTGDFNGDGLLDFAAQDGRELALYIGRDGFFYTRNLVELTGAIRELSSGDFDGDGLFDVAVVTDSGLGSALNIVYGSTSRIGETVELVGRTPKIERMATGDLVGERTGVDGAADLLVVTSSSSGDPGLSVSVLRGDGSRQVISALAPPRRGHFQRSNGNGRHCGAFLRCARIPQCCCGGP